MGVGGGEGLIPVHPRGVSKNRSETTQCETAEGGEDHPIVYA